MNYGQKPLYDGNLPVYGCHLPVNDGQKPLYDGNLPVYGGHLPLNNGHKPSYDDNLPVYGVNGHDANRQFTSVWWPFIT